ncbi:MAG: hypothetical protein GXO39_09440 [Thermotogae bacterium]|nr:hypothetical protein [Thermotogota bacterium]
MYRNVCGDVDAADFLSEIVRGSYSAAKWWNAASRILGKYILPYVGFCVRNNGDVDRKYLDVIDAEAFDKYSLFGRVLYSVIGFQEDILRSVDLVLRAVDPEYRVFSEDVVYGKICLVERQHMQKIYKNDDRYEGIYILFTEDAAGYLVVSREEKLSVTRDPRHIVRPDKVSIVVSELVDPELEEYLKQDDYLTYIKKNIDDVVIFYIRFKDVFGDVL